MFFPAGLIWSASRIGLRLIVGCAVSLTPDVKKYTAIIDQTVEGIEADVKWLERDTGDIEAWLEVHEA